MASGERAKDLVSRRRRNRRESDEEESVAGLGDSQSEASLASDIEDGNEVAEEVDGGAGQGTTGQVQHSGQSATETSSSHQQPKAHSTRSRSQRKAKDSPNEQESFRDHETTFQETADTEIMMHGLKVSDETTPGETVEFDQMTTDQDRSAPRRGENSGEKRRHEQEDYRKKRDADPTFIPNRGNFFMHDARIPEQRGFGPQGRGRGRGRGGIGGAYSPATYVHRYLLVKHVYIPADTTLGKSAKLNGQLTHLGLTTFTRLSTSLQHEWTGQPGSRWVRRLHQLPLSLIHI